MLTAKGGHALSTFHLLGNQLLPFFQGLLAALLSGHRASLLSSMAVAQDAVQISLTKYGIVVNTEKLRSLRDKLFAEELANLEKRLQALRGLALIVWDWSVEIAGDSYRLRRHFA